MGGRAYTFTKHTTVTDKAESKIQAEIIKFLEERDWLVKNMHGNAYQMGIPDLYAAHKRYGSRWIEVKKPIGYAFTPAQLDYFPQLSSKGIGIWILVAATETEYKKLFYPANWYTYLRL